jgi:hypothetical protein
MPPWTAAATQNYTLHALAASIHREIPRLPQARGGEAANYSPVNDVIKKLPAGLKTLAYERSKAYGTRSS